MRNMGYRSLTPLIKRNRRGLSEVIATMLIVLLSVAMIAVIAKFVVPFVKNSLNKSSECLKYRESYKFQEVFYSDNAELRYNCYTDSLVGFSIKGDASMENESELSGFDLVLFEEGSSKKISVRQGLTKTSELRMLNQNQNNIQIPLRGEVRTYVHEKQTGEGQYSYMEVYPVLSSGRVCEASDNIKLRDCLSSVTLSV